MLQDIEDKLCGLCAHASCLEGNLKELGFSFHHKFSKD